MTGEGHHADARPDGTVRRALLVVMASGAVVMLGLGLIGAVALHESTESVDHLTQEVSPARVSNAEFMETMLDAETELRAYLISGEPQQLADHRFALARVPRAEAALEAYAAHHQEMAALVRLQDQRARAWIRDFVRVAAAEGPSLADHNMPLFDLGVRRLDAVKAANQVIDDRLETQVNDARADAQRRLDETVTLMAVLGVLGALICGFLGWRAIRRIRRPLGQLSAVVDRLAAGEDAARADVSGPAEIARLAAAINQMADENARARDVEQEVQERLLEIDRVKSEFVANVSHELRTPLTSISGYLELLSEDLKDHVDPEHAEMMQVMRRNSARLGTLIEDLLDLGRVEREPERLRSVDVSRLMEDVARDLRLSAGSRDVSIILDLDPDAAEAVVLADQAQLHRALLNVLANAVKFSHDGGAVLMHLETTDAQVEVTVTDSGIGIPRSDQDKVGERFYRASNAVSAHIPGTGLGLRMVQTIVSHHRGTFGLSSQEGVGTTATMRLPLQRVDPALLAPVAAEQNHHPLR